MISVIIRAYNEGEHLKRLLEILSFQNIEHEVIIIDSHSRDNTQDIAKRYNSRIIQCSNFTYGRGINIGVSKSKYDIICSLSAHCYPSSDSFLSKLYSHFIDESVAGVYSRQLPVPESNILEKRNICIRFLKERHHRDSHYFNNASSMFRKDLSKRVKFNEYVISLEDILWASDMIDNGYRILYEPNASVYHFHDEPDINTSIRYYKEYSVIERNGYGDV